MTQYTESSDWEECPVCHNDDAGKKICSRIGCINGYVLKR